MVFSKSDVGHPWQFCVAERTKQALKIIAKKLLLASGVPSEFWVYAMKYAATVRNITGVKVHNEFPKRLVAEIRRSGNRAAFQSRLDFVAKSALF